ncbi:MAG: oligosaccharide flippase family protein, partial [Candidatus Rokubacteria bacterium]|nr:oligosaccharide flippase family protein [Candidatus Rokubacteria bacterium]
MSLRTALRRLSAQSLSYGSANLSRKLLAFLLLPLYTAYLSPEDYGIISTVGIIAFLAGTILSLKQDAAVLRLWYDYAGSVECLRRYLGTVILLVASVAIAGALLLSLFSRPLFALFLRDVPFSYVVYGLWTGAAAGLSLIPMMVLRVKEQAFRFGLLQVASFLVTAGLIVYFVVYRGEAALGQVKGMLLGTCVLLLVSLVLLVREVRPGLSLRQAKATVLYGVPLIPQGIAEWVIAGSDRVFLVYHGTLASVGLYSLAYTLGSAVNVLIFSLQQALGPFFFSTAGNREEAENLLPRLATYATLAVSVAVIVVSVFGREAIMVMADPRYVGASQVVPVIASLYLVKPLSLFA